MAIHYYNKTENDVSVQTLDMSVYELVLTLNITNYSEYPNVKYAMIESFDPLILENSDADPTTLNPYYVSDTFEIPSNGTIKYTIEDPSALSIIEEYPYGGFRIHYSETDDGFADGKYAPFIIYSISIYEENSSVNDFWSYEHSTEIIPCNKMVPWNHIDRLIDVSQNFKLTLSMAVIRDVSQCIDKQTFLDFFEGIYNGTTTYLNSYDNNQLIPAQAWRYPKRCYVYGSIKYYDLPESGDYYYASQNTTITGGTVVLSIGYSEFQLIAVGAEYFPYNTKVKVTAESASADYVIDNPSVEITAEAANTEIIFKAYKKTIYDDITLSISHIADTSQFSSYSLRVYNASLNIDGNITIGTSLTNQSFAYNGTGIINRTFSIPHSANTGYWYGELRSSKGLMVDGILQNRYLRPTADTGYHIFFTGPKSSSTTIDTMSKNLLSIFPSLESSRAQKIVNSMMDNQTPMLISSSTNYDDVRQWEASMSRVGLTSYRGLPLTLMPNYSNIIAILKNSTGSTSTAATQYIIYFNNASMSDNNGQGGKISWETVPRMKLPYSISFTANNWNTINHTMSDYGESTVFTLPYGNSSGTCNVGTFVYNTSKVVTYKYIDSQIILKTPLNITNITYNKTNGWYKSVSFSIDNYNFILYYN